MSATTTPALHPRPALLLRLIRALGGEWKPTRVRTAYLDHGYAASKFTTATNDLERLRKAGYLDQHNGPRGRTYTLRGTA